MILSFLVHEFCANYAVNFLIKASIYFASVFQSVNKINKIRNVRF